MVLAPQGTENELVENLKKWATPQNWEHWNIGADYQLRPTPSKLRRLFNFMTCRSCCCHRRTLPQGTSLTWMSSRLIQDMKAVLATPSPEKSQEHRDLCQKVAKNFNTMLTTCSKGHRVATNQLCIDVGTLDREAHAAPLPVYSPLEDGSPVLSRVSTHVRSPSGSSSDSSDRELSPHHE